MRPINIPTRPLGIAMGLTYLGKGITYVVLANPIGVFDIVLGLQYLAKARKAFHRGGARQSQSPAARASGFRPYSVTNIAHQLGYYETIACLDVFTAAPERIAAVTLEEIATAA